MEGFWVFSWVLIPIAGILAGAFKEWLQFKQTQNQLGTSTENLEKKVDVLEKALELSENKRSQLVERIQNLETIVTSTEWDSLDQHLLTNSTPASEEVQRTTPLLEDQIPVQPEETRAMNKAAQLARRLNT